MKFFTAKLIVGGYSCSASQNKRRLAITDYNEDKTVIVDRDTRDVADRSSPVGWIILLVVLLFLAIFLAMGGMRMFSGDTTDNTETQTEETTLPVDDVTPDPAPGGTSDETDTTETP